MTTLTEKSRRGILMTKILIESPGAGSDNPTRSEDPFPFPANRPPVVPAGVFYRGSIKRWKNSSTGSLFCACFASSRGSFLAWWRRGFSASPGDASACRFLERSRLLPRAIWVAAIEGLATVEGQGRASAQAADQAEATYRAGQRRHRGSNAPGARSLRSFGRGPNAVGFIAMAIV